jgi:hypothetical protein
MSKQYTVLVNFAKPWRVRCRSDLNKYKSQHGAYQIGKDGVWYLPVFTTTKTKATRIASTLKTISASM